MPEFKINVPFELGQKIFHRTFNEDKADQNQGEFWEENGRVIGYLFLDRPFDGVEAGFHIVVEGSGNECLTESLYRPQELFPISLRPAFRSVFPQTEADEEDES